MEDPSVFEETFTRPRCADIVPSGKAAMVRSHRDEHVSMTGKKKVAEKRGIWSKCLFCSMRSRFIRDTVSNG